MIIIVVVIVVMRGKNEDVDEPAPMMPEEPMPAEDPYMAAGMAEPEPMPEAEGLEPVPEPQALPGPEETPLELPPGPEGLEEPATAVETEMPMEEPGVERTQVVSGESICPSCGFTVKPGWFLCPECKNPLS